MSPLGKPSPDSDLGRCTLAARNRHCKTIQAQARLSVSQQKTGWIINYFTCLHFILSNFHTIFVAWNSYWHMNVASEDLMQENSYKWDKSCFALSKLATETTWVVVCVTDSLRVYVSSVLHVLCIEIASSHDSTSTVGPAFARSAKRFQRLLLFVFTRSPQHTLRVFYEPI